MSLRRARAFRILAVLVVLPFVAGVGAFVWINRVADQRWAAAQSRIRQLAAAFPEADFRRLPEKSTEASKDNQIHFVAAIRLAAPKGNARGEAAGLVYQRKSGAELDSVLDEAEDFLNRLHQGARRIAASPSEFPSRWHGDWDQLTLTYMMHCCVLRAVRQREQKA